MQRVINAIGVSGEKIIALGDESEVRNLAGTSVEILDLEGGVLFSGLIDSLIHLRTNRDRYLIFDIEKFTCQIWVKTQGVQMPRTQRLIISDETAVYHVMSGTALAGFPLGDIEEDFMTDLIKRYSGLYLVEILGFCLMGNHFHILVKMLPEYKYSDQDIKKRYVGFYGDDRVFTDPPADATIRNLSATNKKGASR